MTVFAATPNQRRDMFTSYGALYCHFVFIIISVTSSMFYLEQLTVSKYCIINSVALNEFSVSEVIIVEIEFKCLCVTSFNISKTLRHP